MTEINGKELMKAILNGEDIRGTLAEGIVTKRVVRDGQWTTIRKNSFKVHKPLSAARKAAIKKAAKAAHKGSANAKRKRSLKIANEEAVLGEDFEGMIPFVNDELGITVYYDPAEDDFAFDQELFGAAEDDQEDTQGPADLDDATDEE